MQSKKRLLEKISFVAKRPKRNYPSLYKLGLPEYYNFLRFSDFHSSVIVVP